MVSWTTVLAQATITRHHRWSGLNKRHFFFTGRLGKSKVKILVDLVPGKDLPPGGL